MSPRVDSLAWAGIEVSADGHGGSSADATRALAGVVKVLGVEGTIQALATGCDEAQSLGDAVAIEPRDADALKAIHATLRLALVRIARLS